MLGIFWTFLGVALASSFKIAVETISDRFLIDLPPCEATKNIEKHNVFLRFLFFWLIALETNSGLILGRFWVPKSSQNRPKIAPERVQKGVENHFCFLMPS